MLVLVNRISASPQWRGARGLPESLERVAETAPDRAIDELLGGLTSLVQLPPHLVHNGQSTGVSVRYSWLGPALATLVKRVLERKELDDATAERIAGVVDLLDRIRDPLTGIRNQPRSFQVASEQHPNFDASYFIHVLKPRGPRVLASCKRH